MSAPVPLQAGAVAIDGRALLIVGQPGTGKSSLALALMDRGATLIGDDSLLLRPDGERLLAAPHPETRGLIEIRGVGLVSRPVAEDVPVALAIRLTPDAPRLPILIEREEFAAFAVPVVALWPDSPVLALRAEAALAQHGLSV